MSEFRPTLSPKDIDPRISPSTKKNSVYKSAVRKATLDGFHEGMAGFMNEAFERAGPNWRVMRVLNLYHGLVYIDPSLPRPTESDVYKKLRDQLNQKNTEDAGAFIWEAFSDVVNVTRAGCVSWEEFVVKNKPSMNRSLPSPGNGRLTIKYTP